MDFVAFILQARVLSQVPSKPVVTTASVDGCAIPKLPPILTAMTRPKIHADEVSVDAALVRRLLADQFPAWSSLPISAVDSGGTDHHIFRLGRDLAIRLPRIRGAEAQAAKEWEWLPKLAPHLPLRIPAPRGLGRPAEGYPFAWSVVEWLPGRDAGKATLDLGQAADNLAEFITALRRIDTFGAPPRPPGARGSPLVELDAMVRLAVAQLGGRIDGDATLQAWEVSLEAPVWTAAEVWIHGDLLPGNLLVRHGRLTGVIDFLGLSAGDPACDLLPAWNLFAGDSRMRFRAELEVDDASWLRGRGWALAQAVVALPYYRDTHPRIVRQASHTLAQVLADRTR